MVKKIIIKNCRECPYILEDSFTDSWYCTADGNMLILCDVDTEIDSGCFLRDE